MAYTSSLATLDVLEKADSYVVAGWRRLVLLVWRGPANAAAVERSRIVCEQWADRQHDGVGFLVVLPRERTGPPDEETRAAMARTARSMADSVIGLATLIEAEGFVAATVRSIMMRLEPAGAKPQTFVRSAAEAASWAAALLGDPEVTAAGLEEAIRRAREA